MMLGIVCPTRHRSAARVSRGLPARTSGRWGCDERWAGGCKDAGEDAHRSRGSVGHSLDWHAKAQVIAVFHTNAGHVTLRDDAYNAERMVATGNPDKQLLAALMQRGVDVELCGATATAHQWGHAELLPGIKVNTDAMARMSQLVQEGFVQITEWD